MRYYVLDKDHQIHETKELSEFAKSVGSPDRILKQERIGPYFISTVFLSLDHNWKGGKPLVFETMVFDEEASDAGNDLEQERYSTWDEAIEGHEKIVKTYSEKVHS